MTPEERNAILESLRKFATQQREADEVADRGSLDRAADIMALYDERDADGERHWAKELPAPKVRRSRGRPVDPESFSRFSKWLNEKVPLGGSRAYQLRDAYELRTNYFHRVEINPSGERALRPLKWLARHNYADRVDEVWSLACELAGGESPDGPTVRRALAQWKKDNLPKTERTIPAERGADARLKRWLQDANWLMENYPEAFVDAVNMVEATAETYFAKEEAVA